MADVFISYAKARPADAVELAGELRKLGYNVWWDTRLLPTGSFATVIDRELDAAKAVVVIWSPQSVRSGWVRSEAAHANRLEKLVNTHVALDHPESQIPKPFGETLSVAAGEIRTIVAALDDLGVPRSGGGGPAAPAVVATDSVADGDDRLFDEVTKANTAVAYEYYLAESPQGRHVLTARLQLKMRRGSSSEEEESRKTTSATIDLAEKGNLRLAQIFQQQIICILVGVSLLVVFALVANESHLSSRLPKALVVISGACLIGFGGMLHMARRKALASAKIWKALADALRAGALNEPT
jgi:hypothetical protein